MLVLGGADAPRAPAPTRWPAAAGPSSAGATAAAPCPARPGRPPRLVDLVGALVAETVAGGDGLLVGVHDVSAGGLGVALAEMAVAAGSGLVDRRAVAVTAELFCELASRVVVATDRPDEVVARAAAAGVAARVLGRGRRGPARRWPACSTCRWPRSTAAWAGALPDAVGDGLDEAPLTPPASRGRCSARPAGGQRLEDVVGHRQVAHARPHGQVRLDVPW